MRFSRSISLFPFTLLLPRLHLLIYFFALFPFSLPLHVLQSWQNSRDDVLILSDLTMLPSRKKTNQHRLNHGVLYRNTLHTSRFIMTPQTNPTTCLPITDSYACLLITVQLALKQRIMVEPPWLSLCVGCWCCCCAVTKPIKRAN